MKAAGKQAVHLGGITQILFGIHGKRWDEDKNHQFLQKYYSDAWVRLTDKEKPKGANVVAYGFQRKTAGDSTSISEDKKG
jgi:hypothetical protein